ncbi:hypothetical protein V8D89_009167 [Ganoderma adspersum]
MLPSLDQKTCLSVSQIFHHIATTYLFSHVTISLGLWRPHGSPRQYSDEEKAAVKRQADAFHDISRHIMHSSDFAKKAKKVSVRAYSSPYTSGEMQVAIRLLADVLRALPDLHRSAWHGPRPTIPVEILEAVVSSASDTLEEFCVPPEFLGGLDTRLTSLKGLRLFGFSDLVKDYVLDEEESRNIPAVIAANAGTLRTLHGLSDEVWARLPPLSSFAHLHELEIVSVRSYGGLRALFKHCAALRAFTLWGVQYTVNDVAVLANFLRRKRHLRRLDVMVRTYTPRWVTDDRSPVLMPLLEILHTLPDLRILVLSFRVTSPEGNHVRYLEAHLPENLTALLVWTDLPSTPVTAQHWIELFSPCTSLQYLHVVPNFHDRGDLHDIFQVHPPKLELFGYGAQIYPLGRGPATGAVVLHQRWVYPKMYFRTADDYGNEDWEWLLRYHGYDNDDHFMHNMETFR